MNYEDVEDEVLLGPGFDLDGDELYGIGSQFAEEGSHLLMDDGDSCPGHGEIQRLAGMRERNPDRTIDASP